MPSLGSLPSPLAAGLGLRYSAGVGAEVENLAGPVKGLTVRVEWQSGSLEPAAPMLTLLGTF